MSQARALIALIAALSIAPPSSAGQLKSYFGITLDPQNCAELLTRQPNLAELRSFHFFTPLQLRGKQYVALQRHNQVAIVEFPGNTLSLAHDTGLPPSEESPVARYRIKARGDFVLIQIPNGSASVLLRSLHGAPLSDGSTFEVVHTSNGLGQQRILDLDDSGQSFLMRTGSTIQLRPTATPTQVLAESSIPPSANNVFGRFLFDEDQAVVTILEDAQEVPMQWVYNWDRQLHPISKYTRERTPTSENDIGISLDRNLLIERKNWASPAEYFYSNPLGLPVTLPEPQRLGLERRLTIPLEMIQDAGQREIFRQDLLFKLRQDYLQNRGGWLRSTLSEFVDRFNRDSVWSTLNVDPNNLEELFAAYRDNPRLNAPLSPIAVSEDLSKAAYLVPGFGTLAVVDLVTHHILAVKISERFRPLHSPAPNQARSKEVAFAEDGHALWIATGGALHNHLEVWRFGTE